jgi:hypothetical protein
LVRGWRMGWRSVYFRLEAESRRERAGWFHHGTYRLGVGLNETFHARQKLGNDMQ